jgi:ADP-ribose pyrophosphatase YjhB (NUDIX family)
MQWLHPYPQHVVQLFLVDEHERFLLMHRSDKVRSAKNVWSIPSGTHEIGESVGECIRREMQEEYHLNVLSSCLVGQYENIAGDDNAEGQYHWIMTLYAGFVQDVTLAVNKEPDKHDEMHFALLDKLADEDFLDLYRFHQSLHSYLDAARHQVAFVLKEFVYSQRIAYSHKELDNG